MFIKIKNEKGVSLYLALVLITIFVGMGLGLTAILVSQKKMVRRMDFGVMAMGGANSGYEAMLYLEKLCNDPHCGDPPPMPGNGASDPCITGFCVGVKVDETIDDSYFSNPLDNGVSYEAKMVSRNCGLNQISSGGTKGDISGTFSFTSGDYLDGVEILNSVTNKSCNNLCPARQCSGCSGIMIPSAPVTYLPTPDLLWTFSGGVCDTLGGDCGSTMEVHAPPQLCPQPPNPGDRHLVRWTHCICNN